MAQVNENSKSKFVFFLCDRFYNTSKKEAESKIILYGSTN